MNSPALGVFRITDWVQSLEKSFMKVRPPGLYQVFTAMCGSCANEIAFMMAFIHHQKIQRGQSDFSMEELEICMKNVAPGSPSLDIYGGTLGTLSSKRSKPIHKLFWRTSSQNTSHVNIFSKTCEYFFGKTR